MQVVLLAAACAGVSAGGAQPLLQRRLETQCGTHCALCAGDGSHQCEKCKVGFGLDGAGGCAACGGNCMACDVGTPIVQPDLYCTNSTVAVPSLEMCSGIAERTAALVTVPHWPRGCFVHDTAGAFFNDPVKDVSLDWSAVLRTARQVCYSTGGAGRCAPNACTAGHGPNPQGCGPCAADCEACQVAGAGRCDQCSAGAGLTSTRTCGPCALHCSDCSAVKYRAAEGPKCGSMAELTTRAACESAATAHFAAQGVFNVVEVSAEPPGCWLVETSVSTGSWSGILVVHTGGPSPPAPEVASCATCALRHKARALCEDTRSGTCDRGHCMGGTVYAHGQCWDPDVCAAHCERCDVSGAGQCDARACVGGFGLYLADGEGTCVACGAQCENCDDAEVCLQCMDGFTANSKGVCEASQSSAASPAVCAEHCTSCSVDGGCAGCTPPYVYDSARGRCGRPAAFAEAPASGSASRSGLIVPTDTSGFLEPKRFRVLLAMPYQQAVDFVSARDPEAEPLLALALAEAFAVDPSEVVIESTGMKAKQNGAQYDSIEIAAKVRVTGTWTRQQQASVESAFAGALQRELHAAGFAWEVLPQSVFIADRLDTPALPNSVPQQQQAAGQQAASGAGVVVFATVVVVVCAVLGAVRARKHFAAPTAGPSTPASYASRIVRGTASPQGDLFSDAVGAVPSSFQKATSKDKDTRTPLASRTNVGDVRLVPPTRLPAGALFEDPALPRGVPVRGPLVDHAAPQLPRGLPVQAPEPQVIPRPVGLTPAPPSEPRVVNGKPRGLHAAPDRQADRRARVSAAPSVASNRPGDARLYRGLR